MGNNDTFHITKKGVLKSCAGNPHEAVIPEGVAEIGKKAFYGRDKLSKAVIPEGVKVIGECAFSECTKLSEIVLPNSLESIEGGAFFLCPLNSITLPEGLTEIGENAFGTTGIRKVVIPQSVRSIGSRAFNVLGGLANAGSLSEVTILGSEVTVGSNAFPAGFSVRIFAPNAPLSLFAAEYKRQIIFTYLTSEAEYPAARVEEYNKYIDKTDDFIGLLIDRDQTAALSRLLQIKTKVKPEKLDEFIAKAHGKAEMEAALLEYQAEMVQPEAREKAEKRKTDIALGVKTMTVAEWKKLFGFEKLEQGLVITAYKGEDVIAEVPEKIGKDTVVAVGESAFSPFVSRAQNKETRRSLRQVILPKTVREIGKNAFYYCSCLKSIEIPDSVEKIGDRAFSDCRCLGSIVIPGSVKLVNRFFTDCAMLSCAVLCEGVESIGSVAFSGCTALAEVRIPASVTFIDSSAFYKCPKITIHAPAGSYAEAYAKEHNIPFVTE